MRQPSPPAMRRLPAASTRFDTIVTGPAISTSLAAPDSKDNRPGDSLLSGGAIDRSIEQIGEDQSLEGIQSVAYSALDIAQRTVPQSYYAGADYLLLKPRFSEPIAYIYGQGNNNQVTANVASFDFNYQSSPRVFLGYRSPTTGAGVQFTYWNFQETTSSAFSSNGQGSGFFPNIDLIFQLIGNGNNNNNGPDFGKSISAQMRLRLNVFDIDLFKPVALSGGRWLLTGSVGARIVDFNQTTNMIGVDISRSPTFTQSQSNNFIGAGPRLALEARRNIATKSALYVRGGYGLLLGGHTGQYAANDIVNANAITIHESLSHSVTVADMEVGGSWRASDNLILSAGWMIQAWTDLGGTGGILNQNDNGNLLSFDGLVVRGSLSF